MEILLREEDGFRFHLPEVDLTRGDERISMCAWCEKVRIGSDWFEFEDAVKILGVFPAPLSPRLSHGLCYSCRDGMKKELEKVRAARNKAKIPHQPH